MKEEKAALFLVSGVFEANLHLYDYIHRLSFSPSGIVEMVDGAGQVMSALVKGRFSSQARDQYSALVHFSDLVELKQKPQFLLQARDPNIPADYSNLVFVENPDYQVEESIRALTPTSVIVTREEGIFPFMRQVIWNISNNQEWPCLLYRVRYRFEIDPLEQVHDRRIGIAYYEQGVEEPDTRYYYCREDAQECTAHELAEMGISFL